MHRKCSVCPVEASTCVSLTLVIIYYTPSILVLWGELMQVVVETRCIGETKQSLTSQYIEKKNQAWLF